MTHEVGSLGFLNCYIWTFAVFALFNIPDCPWLLFWWWALYWREPPDPPTTASWENRWFSLPWNCPCSLLLFGMFAQIQNSQNSGAETSLSSSGSQQFMCSMQLLGSKQPSSNGFSSKNKIGRGQWLWIWERLIQGAQVQSCLEELDSTGHEQVIT